jgi:glycosyltransferase involved in cell wall biosynthesis
VKVLHLNTGAYGGAATGMLRQHFSLLDEGIDSTVLTALGDDNTLPRVFTAEYAAFKPIVVRFANKLNLLKSELAIEKNNISKLAKPFYEGGTFELFSSPFSDYKLHEHPLVKSADIINLHWISGFVDIPSFLKHINKPVIWTLHDMNPYLGGFHYDIDAQNNPQLSGLESKYLRIKKDALNGIKYGVIGNSKWSSKNALESSMFKNSFFSDTIYHPLNKNQFSAVKKSVAKKALNLPEGKFIIGFASENLNNPRKGFADLLAAIKLIPSSIKQKLHCLTFGGVRVFNEIETGISFTQLGSVNNTSLQSIIYSAMDTFIIPSKAEAFGLTALEAMACKTPVIGYNTGGIPETVKNDNTGFLVKNNGIPQLTEAILRMIDLDEIGRIRLGENAAELVQEQHFPKKIALQYANAYYSLL